MGLLYPLPVTLHISEKDFIHPHSILPSFQANMHFNKMFLLNVLLGPDAMFGNFMARNLLMPQPDCRHEILR